MDPEEDDLEPENPHLEEEWEDSLAPDDLDLDNQPDDEEEDLGY